jgi:phosphonatase-like hydrolase
MVHHVLTSPDLAPIAGAEAAFAELRAHGARVALATGFGRRVLNAILLRLGWYEGDVIDVSVASDEVEHGRPAPDLVFRAMTLTGVRDPGRVAKVGDTVADVREGIAAGCGLVVGVTTGTATKLALRAERPSLVLPSVASIVAAVRAAERVGLPLPGSTRVA